MVHREFDSESTVFGVWQKTGLEEGVAGATYLLLLVVLTGWVVTTSFLTWKTETAQDRAVPLPFPGARGHAASQAPCSVLLT